MAFKYYSDEFLEIHDLFNKMSVAEAIGYQLASGSHLLPDFEIPYLTGDMQQFKIATARFMAINRILKNDTTGKYRKLLEARGVLNFNDKPKNNMMFG